MGQFESFKLDGTRCHHHHRFHNSFTYLMLLWGCQWNCTRFVPSQQLDSNHEISAYHIIKSVHIRRFTINKVSSRRGQRQYHISCHVTCCNWKNRGRWNYITFQLSDNNEAFISGLDFSLKLVSERYTKNVRNRWID